MTGRASDPFGWGGLYMVKPATAAEIAAEQAAMMNQVIGQLLAPVPGGAMEFLADAISRRNHLRAAALPDGIEIIEDEISVERDAAEAERFRLELERDARAPDEDL